MPVDAPDGTFADPRARPSNATSTSMVGLPREASRSRAWTDAMLLLGIGLLVRLLALLRLFDRCFGRGHRIRGAGDLLSVVPLVVKLPGVEPDHGNSVNERIGDLAQRPV